MGYEIINPKPLKQIGTICISKKDNDHRPIYALDEVDAQLGATMRIGSTKNYSQPQFVKDSEGRCNYNPLFITYLVKQISTCTLLLWNDEHEAWDMNNKLYFSEFWLEAKKS